MDRVNLSQYSRASLSLWLLLSFQAGFVNVGGLLACHRFVTHVTGFATQFGAEFAQNNWLHAASMLSVPLFFLAGAIFSAFFVDHQIQRGKRPLYFVLAGLVCLLMIFISGAGQNDFFGPFGTPYDVRRDYLLVALLCLCSGIQNAAVTSASGAVLRTTHLTGITTDLGIGLVRLFSGSRDPRETQGLRIRLSVIAGFISGSLVGAFAFLHYAYSGFLIPALISGSLFLMGFRR